MNRTAVLDSINADGYESVFNQIKDAIATANQDIADAETIINEAQTDLQGQRESLYWFAQIAHTNGKMATLSESKEKAVYQVILSDQTQWKIEVEPSKYTVADVVEVTPSLLGTLSSGTERDVEGAKDEPTKP